eukprot:CAMPEP_0183753394 /NCGR_PEP_ID=MMETSP0739-20130205/2911_1 /TAXON_ID=385413 /ORGANISM="Thalassiosira miniscula, Strain CCMP1093" /LENGTH=421 /DNA_ID=CAMNT_0025989873 /DNA_START=42 /DNA_END=1307 /DNA_ORIENTATION=+
MNVNASSCGEPSYHYVRPSNHPMKKDEYINSTPTTVSADASSSHCNNSSSAIVEALDTATRGEDEEVDRRLALLRHSCPVTGRLSNILDDYVVLPKCLGEGQYGQVRECIHRKSWRTYACKSIEKKTLRGGLSMNSSRYLRRIENLRNEVKLLSEINHENIMDMVDCYEDTDYVHIVSESYTGGLLFDKIIRNTNSMGGGCPERDAACIIKSLLEAVSYLHENDIVHRDIKPDNILFSSSPELKNEESQEEEVLKLVDFGLSRRHRCDEPLMTSPVGTCYYMSPEVLAGSYDKSCDLWSVGVIAYILLCGYPPFNGETDHDVYDAIEDCSDVESLFSEDEERWNVHTSSHARSFVKCLLERDVKKRYTAKMALLHPWIANLDSKKNKNHQQQHLRNGTKNGRTTRLFHGAGERKVQPVCGI